jgi:hypothetical protein
MCSVQGSLHLPPLGYFRACAVTSGVLFPKSSFPLTPFTMSTIGAVPTKTYNWFTVQTKAWQYASTTYTQELHLSSPADHWSMAMLIAFLPYKSGIFLPPDDQTMTPGDKTYSAYGCEISINTDPDRILFRRSPFPQSESSVVETKTLIPPAEISRSGSAGAGENLTANSDGSGSGSSASAIQSGNGSESTAAAIANEKDPQSLGGGAIAGIAIGGILVLAFIIGGWYFWRRRKRARAKDLGSQDDEQARRGRHTVVSAAPYSPHEKPLYIPYHQQEMPGDIPTPTQELEYAFPSEYAMDAAREHTGKAEYKHEPAYELHPEARPAELPYGGQGHVSPLQHHAPAAAVDEGDAIEETGIVSKAVSADVEAQRRREMEWLDREEERIRKKRETLSMQTSGKG